MVRPGPVLEAQGISKRYPGVLANDDVSITAHRGEVIGVLGENGAGKSTLMSILGGLVMPDAGSIRVGGEPARFRSAADAADAGIGMVHQHFMLVRDFTVVESLALGSGRWGRFRIDTRRIRQELRELTTMLGIDLDPDATVGTLPVGAQQQVEIVRSLIRRPRILILDEPTALLSVDERAALNALVRRLAADGTAVLLISHKLDDILASCDRVVVMRRGRVVGECPVSGRSREDLVRLVVGGEPPAAPRGEANHRPGADALTLDGICLAPAKGFCGLHDVGFALRAGEIVALCGVEGNGQSELFELIAGMRRADRGVIDYRLAGSGLRGPQTVRALRSRGVAHIPEDRLHSGGLAALPLVENWLLTHADQPPVSRHGWLTRSAVSGAVTAAIGRHGIRARSPADLLGALSGGNQQKFVIARELAHRPSLVLAANPTRGLDVQTVAEVEALLLAARDGGACVLWLTSDLSDVWAVADRVMVMAGGRVRGPVDVGATSPDEVGHWMTSH